jgi:hypothetical protein
MCHFFMRFIILESMSQIHEMVTIIWEQTFEKQIRDV